MRATIVNQLEQKFKDRFSQIEKKTIAENLFLQTAAIVTWLEQLIAEKVKGKKSFRNFENAITGDIKTILQEGDDYYFKLFRQEKIINEKTAEKESNNPYTKVVRAIYNSLFKNNHSFNEQLTVYHALRLQIEKEIGVVLALDTTLQNYKIWLKIYQTLEIEHDIYSSWIINIPLHCIIDEKANFSLIHKLTLDQLAYVRGYVRNNKAEAKNYIAYLGKLSAKSALEYITEVTRGSDLLTLKSEPELQQTLVRKLGAADWLLFIDSLHFPNLQDHAFLSVNELNEYPEIISEILKNPKLKTPGQHLLLIALENYFDFIARTITDLLSLSQSTYYDEMSIEIDQLKKEALNEYNCWLNNYVPDSYNSILNGIFYLSELKQSGFFLVFFEWVCSHGQLNMVHQGNESKKALIDSLNKLFLKRLGDLESDRHFLIENLQTNQVNFEALDNLFSIYVAHKNDLNFRDKLYSIYLDFISAKSFRWHAGENVDFEYALNNAYYFSQILCSYNDGYEKWISLFHEYKTAHEGWHFTHPDYKIYQKESFLLTSGIGMSYFSYTESNDAAATIFLNVTDLLIQQHRNAGKGQSVDYATPLKFAAITVGRHRPENSEDFLKLIAARFDGLKYILIVIAVLKEYNQHLFFSEPFKRHICNRIDDEFWIIENRKSDLLLKQSLDYYKNLKKTAIEICCN